MSKNKIKNKEIKKISHPIADWQTNEHGFLLVMVFFATSGLLYLFNSFLLPLVFAIILASSTYPLLKKIKKTFNISNTKSSFLSTLIIFLLVVMPLAYLASTLGFKSSYIIKHLSDIQNNLDFSSLEKIKILLLEYTPITNEQISFIVQKITENSSSLFVKLKDFFIYISSSLFNNSLSFVSFIFISFFSLFFFFRDGDKIIEKIKILSPLHDYYDDLLIKEISYLSSVLMLSVVSVALLQCISFSILTIFMDLDWFFIGIAILVSSFIPVIGSSIVWVPLSIYLYGTGKHIESGIVIFWGIFVAGFIIDNIARPFIISKIVNSFKNEKNEKIDDEFSPLNHTLLVVLSTFGGLLTFGVLGLFLGPIIAAFSISIYGVYILRIKNLK